MLIFLFVTLRVYRRYSFEGTYFEQALCHGLWVNFETVFTFSEAVALSDALDNANFPRQVEPQFFFYKIAVENCENSKKIGVKVCGHHFL